MSTNSAVKSLFQRRTVRLATGCLAFGLIGFGLLVFCFFAAMAGILVPSEVLLYSLTGWAIFLVRAWSSVQLNGSSMVTAGVSLALFSTGLHLFLNWFYDGISAGNRESATMEASSVRQNGWRVRWTGQIVALTFIMFVAGISMIGLTHQVAWLASANKPLLIDRSGMIEQYAPPADEAADTLLEKPITADN